MSRPDPLETLGESIKRHTKEVADDHIEISAKFIEQWNTNRDPHWQRCADALREVKSTKLKVERA